MSSSRTKELPGGIACNQTPMFAQMTRYVCAISRKKRNKPVEKSALSGLQLYCGLIDGKPTAPIHLRHRDLPPRPGWPLHRKHITSELFRIAVSLEGPRCNDFSGTLFHVAQCDELPSRGEACFFAEFAFGRVQRLLISGVLTLRNRPCLLYTSRCV